MVSKLLSLSVSPLVRSKLLVVRSLAQCVVRGPVIKIELREVNCDFCTFSAAQTFTSGPAVEAVVSGDNIHAVVGRLSFSQQQLEENIEAFMKFIESLKPNSIKGTYVKGVSLAATMSPGVPVAA